MEVKTVYIAIDGTEFEEKTECLAYEASLVSECDFIRLYHLNGELIKWNPDNYDDMWNHLYYIVIEPHREREAEEWWEKTFDTMLSVNPFSEMGDEWTTWKLCSSGNEPTILAFDFAGNDSWIIFNKVYNEVKGVVRDLDLVDVLS